MSQKAIALGSVAGAVALGSAWSYNRLSTTVERHTFIVDGLRSVNMSPEMLGLWRIAQVDKMNNVGFATVGLSDGRTVRITAKRLLKNEKNSVKEIDSSSVYDDLEGQGSGLAFYWENPWEIKASIIREIGSGIDLVKGYFTQPTNESPEADEWEVTSVSIDDDDVVGSRLSHPFFASKSVSNNVKSDESKNRTFYFLSVLGASACWILARRVYVNYRLWPSYVFARNYIQKHPLVVELYQGETAEVVARTGEMTRTKIDAEITLSGGKNIKTESVVKFAATRKNHSSPWIVSKAVLTPGGTKPIDLLVARSLI
jgi:hypothetical protein